MPSERITLPRKVREYFAAIGKRGGQTGRRELTRQQAKLLVAIRGKRNAPLRSKKAKLPPKIDRKTLARFSGSPKQNGINQFSPHRLLSTDD